MISTKSKKAFLFYASPDLDKRVKVYQHKHMIESKSETIRQLLDRALADGKGTITDRNDIVDRTDIKDSSVKKTVAELREIINTMPEPEISS